MAGFTLDAGVLIALERGDPTIVAFMQRARLAGRVVVIPAPVLAQSWRGSRSARIAALLAFAIVEPMSEEIAKGIGELLTRSRTSDVVDAMVVLTAASRGDQIVTGDVSDLARLAGHVRGLGPIRSLADLPRH